MSLIKSLVCASLQFAALPIAAAEGLISGNTDRLDMLSNDFCNSVKGSVQALSKIAEEHAKHE